MPVEAIHGAGAFGMAVLGLERREQEVTVKLLKPLADGNPLVRRRCSRNGQRAIEEG
jgi:hypothetical protein